MFTGIIEEIGTVEAMSRGACSAALAIRAERVLQGTRVGDSIAVNGVCLTVTALSPGRFTADVMHETLDRSALSRLAPGTPVNLERAMHADGRFGGHIVAGHVDGVGTVTAVRRDDNAVWFSIQASPTVLRYMVKKGSVTVDGVSLTIARLERGGFSVSVIPHTAEQTVLSLRRPGDPVNLEADIIAKYVDALLRPAPDSVGHGSGITREFLSQYGF